MFDLVGNFTETIKQLLQKYWLFVVIYFIISLVITYCLGSGTRGFAFLLAIPLVALGLYLANQRTEALLKQTKTDSDRLLTETFAKSIELLGHEQEAVRQGAIYALGKIAETNSEELTVIVNTLCAFIRHNRATSKYKDLDNSNNKESAEKVKKYDNLPIDIEAAIKTIVKLSDKFELDTSLDSTRYDLSNIYLPYADFSRAKLIHFNLSDSYFYNCIFEKVDFSHSNLVGSNFEESSFKEATFNDETEIMKTDFSSTQKLNQVMINEAKGDKDTQLPTDIQKPNKWNKSV